MHIYYVNTCISLHKWCHTWAHTQGSSTAATSSAHLLSIFPLLLLLSPSSDLMPNTGLSRAGPGGLGLLGLEQRQTPHLLISVPWDALLLLASCIPWKERGECVHPQPTPCRGRGTNVCFGNNNSSAFLLYWECWEGCKQVNKTGAAFMLNTVLIGIWKLGW